MKKTVDFQMFIIKLLLKHLQGGLGPDLKGQGKDCTVRLKPGGSFCYPVQLQILKVYRYVSDHSLEKLMLR